MESSEGFSVSNDRTIIAKRKRSNRPRPPPPPSSTSTSASASSSAATDSFTNSYSPTTSSAIEDEDMANCLILLARGRHSPPPPAASSGGYDCKTCGKSFPSFQALGGHRASHKKPKNNNSNTADPKISPVESTAAQPPEEQQEEEAQFATKVIDAVPPILHRRMIPQPDPNRTKIHECSICGSEFGSGQALGGHMRRHRPAPTTPATFEDNGVRSKSVVTFDLNLPAPQEDDRFRQLAPHVGFASAAALVDCHY